MRLCGVVSFCPRSVALRLRIALALALARAPRKAGQKARGGSKKRPFYRIVIADERAPRDGNFIEKIGNFNPMVPKDHKERVVISKERAEHWLKVGAQPTDRVQRILADLGMMDAPKITEKTKKHLPKAKAQERTKAKEEAALKAEEEAKAAAEAAKIL